MFALAHFADSVGHPPRSEKCHSGQTRPRESPMALMSPTWTHIGILHRDGPPSSINLTHDAGTNGGAFGLVNVPMYVELGMHHGDVRTEKAHMHYWRLASTHSEWSAGTVEALH